MKALFVLAAALYASLRGLAEGITMFKPGPREHPWFRWYHQLRIGEALGLMASVFLALKFKVTFWTLAGTLFIAWELTELGYALARLGQSPFGHENILGFWTVDSIPLVLFLHAARCCIAGVCIFAGRTGER